MVRRETARSGGWEQERIVEKNQKANPPGQIQVELGEHEAEGIYSNLVFIAHSASEVILDFARALPGLPKAKVYARIILTQQHAKSLLVALYQHLKTYGMKDVNRDLDVFKGLGGRGFDEIRDKVGGGGGVRSWLDRHWLIALRWEPLAARTQGGLDVVLPDSSITTINFNTNLDASAV